MTTYSRVVALDPTQISCTLRYCDLLWTVSPDDVLGHLKKLCEAIDEMSPDALLAFEYWAVYSERHERMKRGLSPVHATSLDDLHITYATDQRDKLVDVAQRRLSTNGDDVEALVTLALYDVSQDNWNDLEAHVQRLKPIAQDPAHLNLYINNTDGTYLESVNVEDIEAELPPVIESIVLPASSAGTLFLCSDPKYFYRFTAPLLLSLEAVGVSSRAQIHIMDGESLDLAKTKEFLSRFKHVQCGLSFEKSGLGDKPPKQRVLYFHAVRYVRLFQALSSGGGPFCITDVDGLFIKDPEDIFCGHGWA